MRMIALGGFLGAGKTTTMLAAARRLERAGDRVAVITNDQGAELVDTRLARATATGPVAEVTGGCLCCRFDDLAAAIAALRDDTDPTVVLAEAVGTCTDLQSTVIRPLRHFYAEALTVAPLTVIVDPLRYRANSDSWTPADEPDLAYLYRHQLDEAEIIAVNKSDLLSPAQSEQLCGELGQRFPAAIVIPLCAANGAGIDELITLWARREFTERRPFDIDYDRYGAAEAALAWTNQTFALRPRSGAVLRPADWVDCMLDEFARASAEAAATIGHVKVLAAAADGITKASLVGTDSPNFDHRQETPAGEVTVTVNARVQSRPDALDALIHRSIAVANAACSVESDSRSGKAFRPGYPVPVHRL
jgi:G3E family GTPase